MPRALSILSLIAAATIGSAGLAQDAAEDATDTTPATEEPAQGEAPATGEDTGAGGDSAFSTGREVNETDQDPTYIKAEYDAWSLRCFRNPAGEDPCQMYQLLTEAGGNPVAEFSIFKIEESGPAVAGATVIVPLLTLLKDELKISVDGGAAKSYPYRFCSPAGCVAQIGLTQQDLDQFKRGAKAVMTLVPAQAPDQTVRIDVSLTGFTAAYGNVSVFNE